MLKPLAVIALLSTALAVSCATTPAELDSAVRVDSTSSESAEASYMVMMSSRSDADRRKLALAVLMLNLDGVKSAYDVMENPELKTTSIGRIRTKVAGMTADEIIALAAQVTSIRLKVHGQ